MNPPETPPIWRPVPNKLRAYEAVYWLNRSFEATLLSLERLEQLGIFRLEYLNEYKVRIEHTRAQTNEELVDALHEQEMDDSARFDRIEREWENQRKDPDDVFFHSRPQAADQRTDQGTAEGIRSPAIRTQRTNTQETSWMIEHSAPLLT